MENKFTYVKIGLMAIIGFFLMVVLFTWKSGAASRYDSYQVVGEFSNVGGLLETGEVRYRGYKVGEVTAIDPRADKIKVYAKIKSGVGIPVGSRFRISFDGLVGQKYINVVPGNSLDVLQNGDVVEGISVAGIVDFIDEGARSMEEVQLMIRNINDLLGSSELKDKVARSADNIEKVTAELAQSAPYISATLKKLDKITTELEVLTVSDDSDVKTIVRNLKDSSQKLEVILKEINTFTEKPENKENIEKTLKNLKEITDTLNEKGIKVKLF